jgi:succinate dehydrogenase/fumarate reductase cytochrome b subunit
LVIFDSMNNRLKNSIALSIIPQIILVKWIGQYPRFIESYYSLGLYQFLSKISRTIFGWLPFSVGDIIYALLFLAIVRYLILNKKKIKQQPKSFIRNIFVVLSTAYFTFHLLWGLNYYRVPLNETLSLEETNSRQALVSFVEKLIDKTNKTQVLITADSTLMVTVPYSKKEILEKTIKGYEELNSQYSIFNYQRPSLKTSLFSTGLSYMGYGGYLNPFTNEAQVNALLPNFRFPVVAGHEVGHQLGYSAENETNFIGYLVTVSNRDMYFKYSAYAYALAYCLSDIKKRDEPTFKRLLGTINSGVKMNYKEISDFWSTYENPTEPVFKSIFDTFLKANNQSKGIESYNAVVSLLINYHEQHPL